MHLSKDAGFPAESNAVKRDSTPRPYPLISGILCFLNQNPQQLGLRSKSFSSCTVPEDDRTWTNLRIYVVLFSPSRQMLEQYLHYATTISFHIFPIQIFSYYKFFLQIRNRLGGPPSHVFTQLVAGLKRPGHKTSGTKIVCECHELNLHSNTRLHGVIC